MNETLHGTMIMIRALSRASNIKVSRGYADFLADRITIAGTEASLLSVIERLSKLLNTEIEYVGGDKIAAFMRVVNAVDAPGVVQWLRDYPKVAAMIATLKNDEDVQVSLAQMEIIVNTQARGKALPQPPFAIPMTITCLSSLAHGGDSKAGNATLFRRMQVLSDTGYVLSLPFYAGNALRGQMRDLLADHFLSAMGLVPSNSNPPCKLWFFHALYSGGKLEENSQEAKALTSKLGGNGAVKAEGIHELRNMIPPISVLGTALGNRIISGRINVGDCRPRCQEWGNGATEAASLMEWTFLTRREDYEAHSSDEKSAAMIANSECLRAGTILDGGIDLSEHLTEIERACLGKGLTLLQQRGYLGAENRRGLGRVQIAMQHVPDAAPYDAFLTAQKADIITYLETIGAINAPSELNFGSPA